MGLVLHQNLDLWGTQIPSIYQLAVGVPVKEYLRPASRKTKSCVKVLGPSCVLAALGLSGLLSLMIPCFLSNINNWKRLEWEWPIIPACLGWGSTWVGRLSVLKLESAVQNWTTLPFSFGDLLDSSKLAIQWKSHVKQSRCKSGTSSANTFSNLKAPPVSAFCTQVVALEKSKFFFDLLEIFKKLTFSLLALYSNVY